MKHLYYRHRQKKQHLKSPALFNQQSVYLKLLIILGVLLPLARPLKDIVVGSIPFWNDPARDLLAALNNLKKPSLIGPPTGIPGIFYGPYWIWLNSLALLFSKDPRVVVFIVQVLPYLLVPFILAKLSDKNQPFVWLPFWWLFALSYRNYLTYHWNPHLGPVVFAGLVFLISRLKSPIISNLKQFFLVGLVAGLLANFHMSFGSGVILATTFYLVGFSAISFFASRKRPRKSILVGFKNLASFATGILIIYSSFFVFDLRHDFLQTKAFVSNFTESVINKRNIIGLNGISREELPRFLFDQGAKLFQLPLNLWQGIFWGTLIVFLVRVWTQAIKLDAQQTKILVFISLSALTGLGFYLFSKNPVWQYHFIGFETIFLILFLVLAQKLPFLKTAIIFWVAYLFIVSAVEFYRQFYGSPLVIQSVAAKTHAVDLVFKDAGKTEFAAFALAPNSYTYDYDYLLITLAEKYHHPPVVTQNVADLPVYLILPETEAALILDFINFKTPREKYSTYKKWQLPDGTVIYKRQKGNLPTDTILE